MDLITLKDYPVLSKLVKPFSKKHKAVLSRQCTVVLSGTYWDGGSRSDYHLVEIATGNIRALPRTDPPQFGGSIQSPQANTALGFVIIKTGVFCGKLATPFIFIHPDEKI